jgi:hypothetical protein
MLKSQRFSGNADLEPLAEKVAGEFCHSRRELPRFGGADVSSDASMSEVHKCSLS